MSNNHALLHNGRIAIEILESQIGQLRCVLRTQARNERSVVCVEQFNQQVVFPGRIARHQFRDQHIFITTAVAKDREVFGNGVLVPRPTFVTQVYGGVNVCAAVDGVCVEQEIDAVVIAVTIIVVKQLHIGIIDPEIMCARLRNSAHGLATRWFADRF